MTASGRLLGGRVRVSLQANEKAPITTSEVKVALVVPELGVLLTASGKIEVLEPEEEPETESSQGGEPNIEIAWVKRDKWASLEFTEQSVGRCTIDRDDPAKPAAITKVTWIMNEDFGPFERVVAEKEADRRNPEDPA